MRYLAYFLHQETDVFMVTADLLRAFCLYLSQKPGFQNHPFTPPQKKGLSGHTINTYQCSIKGFFSWLVNLLSRFNIRPKFLEKNMDNIQETDELISKFYSHHKRIFSIVFVLHSISFIFWIYEIFLTLKLTGAEAVTFLKSFLVTTLGCLVILLPSTPASIGTYEITYITLIVLVGIAAGAGVTLTLMRRIISVTWAGIGLFLMLMTPRTKKIVGKEIE